MATEQLETLGTEDAKWLGEYSQVHMNVFGTPLRVMDHGEGAHIWDVDGNEYLDFLAGIAVNALGYAHPKWVKAVSEQAAKAAHVSNYFATEPQIKLAAKLVKLAGAPEGSRVYFGNSGAEGNEAALKLAKLYGRTLPGALPEIGGKPARIISMTHGFHGRTMGALSATWSPPSVRNSSRWYRTSNSSKPATSKPCTTLSPKPAKASTAKGRSRPSSWSLSRARPV